MELSSGKSIFGATLNATADQPIEQQLSLNDLVNMDQNILQQRVYMFEGRSGGLVTKDNQKTPI